MQEVVILLSKLITQIGFILTSKTDHLFDAFGITEMEKYKVTAIILLTTEVSCDTKIKIERQGMCKSIKTGADVNGGLKVETSIIQKGC